MAGERGVRSSRVVSEGAVSNSNGVGYERVGEIQRARMLAAMAEVVCEHGVEGVTVAHVVARSGVSRRTFYENFGDREDCFLAAFEDGIARASAHVHRAYSPEVGWRERVRGSLVALLGFLDAEPFLGRLLVVESLGAGARARERRQRVLTGVVAALDEGRGEARSGFEIPKFTAEGVVGAVVSVVYGRLLARDRGRLVELVNPLMSMIVLPYLGPAAARRELGRPVAKVSVSAPIVSGNPLSDLGMRLTYRTVRVLMAVGANPGSSNRLVAEESGIGDQGQISKLLARIERSGLVENVGMGSVRGAPNAWRLTERGREVHGAIAAQTSSI
jgi:AcrR family transcriptional regulator